MTTNPVRPGHASGGNRPGAQPGQGGRLEGNGPVSHAPGMLGGFDVALRGYERSQVDARIAELVAQLAAAAEQNRATAARLADEQRRTEHAERQLREAREKPPATPPGGDSGNGAQGFGYRAERILRMAEAEAHETRSAAAKEAAELLERARAEAEIHRHEIEQNLIMRATSLDQKASEVSTALREREQAAAAELASARTEAESVRAAARHEMEQARKNVEVVIRDLRAQAERWAEEHRAAATREVARLVGLRDKLHGDLTTLSQNLLTGVKAEGERGEPAGPRTNDPMTSPMPAQGRTDPT